MDSIFPSQVLVDAHGGPRTNNPKAYLATGRGIDPRRLDGWLEIDGQSSLFLDNEDDVDKLKRTAKTFDAILIDSLSRVHKGDESSARDAAIVCAAWREVSLATNTSTLFVHHFNGKGQSGDRRSPGHRIRGSSRYFVDSRHVVGLQTTSDRRVVTVSTEGNLPFQPAPFGIELVASQLDGRQSLAYRQLGPVASMGELRAREAVLQAIRDCPGMGKRAVRKALEKCSHRQSQSWTRWHVQERSRLVRHSEPAPPQMRSTTWPRQVK